jgi:hypothetical protein
MVETGPSRQGAELRRHRRQPLHYPAWIVLAADQPPYKCMLSDVSKAGAKISIAGHLEVPDEFSLLLSEDGSTRRSCRVVWRESTHMGVEFTRQSRSQDGAEDA